MKYKIRKWAAGLLQREDLVILDTETTGLGSTDEVIQIGAIDAAGTVLLDTLVRPARVTVGAGAEKVHGIKTADLGGAPSLAELDDDLLRLLQDRPVAVYNVPFDRSKLGRSAWANGRTDLMRLFVREVEWHCVMEAYAAYYGQRRGRGYKWQSLTAACEQQGIEINGAHTAVGDAQMTLALLRKMAAEEPSHLRGHGVIGG